MRIRAYTQEPSSFFGEGFFVLEFFDPNFFLAREFPILTPTHPADWPKLDSCHIAELGSAAENVSGENLGRISVVILLAENVSPYAPPTGRFWPRSLLLLYILGRTWAENRLSAPASLVETPKYGHEKPAPL